MAAQNILHHIKKSTSTYYTHPYITQTINERSSQMYKLKDKINELNSYLLEKIKVSKAANKTKIRNKNK